MRFENNIQKLELSLRQILNYTETYDTDMSFFTTDFPFKYSFDESYFELTEAFEEYLLGKEKKPVKELLKSREKSMMISEIAELKNILESIKKEKKGMKIFNSLCPNIISEKDNIDTYLAAISKWLISSTKNHGTNQQKMAYIKKENNIAKI